MNVSYREFLETPVRVVADYLTVMAGEAEARKPPNTGAAPLRNDGIPAGFELELVEG